MLATLVLGGRSMHHTTSARGAWNALRQTQGEATPIIWSAGDGTPLNISFDSFTVFSVVPESTVRTDRRSAGPG